MMPEIFVLLLLPEEISAQRFASGIQTAAGSGAAAPGLPEQTLRLSPSLVSPSSVYILSSLGSSFLFLRAYLQRSRSSAGASAPRSPGGCV